MKPLIELGVPSEPIDGVWRWYSCEYSLDGGKTWHDGEVQSDGHAMAEWTLTDDAGNNLARAQPPAHPTRHTEGEG